MIRLLSCEELRTGLLGGKFDGRLDRIYCCGGDTGALDEVRTRALGVLDRYMAQFDAGDGDGAVLLSSPGRTEIGGNHTDHQHGNVLAASVNMDMLACAAPNGTSQVRIHSEGFPPFTVDIADLSPRKDEENTSQSLVRGVAAAIADSGHRPEGFDAYITSSIPPGSGLSSSAAFEVLMGNIYNAFFCGGEISDIDLAKIGQYAENVFFGKPCGLMDQMGSAVGSTVAIDFTKPYDPVVQRVDYNFAASGYSLCIIDSGADHADLTGEYAAITEEMSAVAAAFGQQALRDVEESRFKERIPELRKTVGDRAILRALHFFAETRRARKEAEALEEKDFPRFLQLVRESGKSSGLYLQNLSVARTPREQAVTLALCVAEGILGGSGAVRVHGGGFAGTLQAFVPNGVCDRFKAEMEALLGPDHCHFVQIRPEGGCVLFGL